jgi:putative Mn2+ efflux pump MntP
VPVKIPLLVCAMAGEMDAVTISIAEAIAKMRFKLISFSKEIR